jgi:hypothetical protein
MKQRPIEIATQSGQSNAVKITKMTDSSRQEPTRTKRRRPGLAPGLPYVT